MYEKGERLHTRAWIARDGEVACRVNTCARLHLVLEGGDSGLAGDEGCDLGGRSIALGEVV